MMMTETTNILMRVRRYLSDQEFMHDHLGDGIPAPNRELRAVHWIAASEYNAAVRLVEGVLDDEGWPTHRDVLETYRGLADGNDPSGSALIFMFAIGDLSLIHISEPTRPY